MTSVKSAWAPSLAATVLLVAVTAGAAGREDSLLEAVKGGNLAAVDALLHKRADVNQSGIDGTSPLHWAAHRNDLAMVERLIAAGASVEARNRYGATALWLACENGGAAVVRRLLAAGADPNLAAADGETNLMIAARTGDPESVAALVAHGAEVNRKEIRLGQTALMWAASENNGEATTILIEAGADLQTRSRGGFTALLFAARAGHLDSLSALAKAGANVNDALPDGTSALTLAIMNAHFELAAMLADRGADPNADLQGWTPLHQLIWTRRPNAALADPPAVATGTISSLALADRLLARGANPNSRIKKDRNLGLEDRTLFNRLGTTPFLLAAQTADVHMMKLLAGRGADPTVTNVDGTTALMAAAGVGIWVVGENPGTNEEALEAVKLALELGGVPTATNDFGYTALHGAAHRAAPDIVRLLVERGARLDVKLTKTGGGALGWKEGWTPLAIAEGVYYANTFKRSPETAVVLRRLMQDRGLAP